MATRCKFRGRRGILCDVLKIDGSLARNIDFEVANFSGSTENSWENVDFEATKCENWRRSRTKCSFWCSHLSRLACLVFPWPRRVYGGSCKTCPFVMLPTVKIAGSLVRNAGFSAIHVSCLESLVFLASPCLWGKLENISYSNVSKQVVMPFCVAGVALCDIPTCLMLFTNFKQMGEVSHEMLVFLHPRVSSRVSGFPVASPCLWGKLRTPHSTLYTPQFTL